MPVTMGDIRRTWLLHGLWGLKTTPRHWVLGPEVRATALRVGIRQGPVPRARGVRPRNLMLSLRRTPRRRSTVNPAPSRTTTAKAGKSQPQLLQSSPRSAVGSFLRFAGWSNWFLQGQPWTLLRQVPAISMPAISTSNPPNSGWSFSRIR